MRSIKRTSLPLLLVLLGVFACVIPAVPQVDQNAAGTAVQGTLSAILKQTEDAGQGIVDISSNTPAPSATLAPSETLASTETFTSIPPSFTPSHTLTVTFTPTPTVTFTPEVPMVSVSVATNCRLGPGKVYQLVGYLPENQWVRVYARDPAHDYWYIRNPANSFEFCWIWGEFATVIGQISNLPIYTPPPSPTPTMTSTPAPAFDAAYVGLQSCAGKFWADLKLKNTGTGTFRSMSVMLRDAKNGVSVSLIKDGFTDRTGCTSVTKDTLLPGKSLTASSPAFAYNPSGHTINATITLCTAKGLNGYCITRKISFKP